MSPSSGATRRPFLVGLVLVAAGLAVFAIRLRQPGPYVMPEGGHLRVAVACLGLGALLQWRGLPRLGRTVTFVLTPFALGLAVFAVAAESEEVVVLHATDRAGRAAALRLWIVDRDDGTWLGMASSKAVEHALAGRRHDLVRGGERHCVVPSVVEDRSITRAVHAQKIQKYRVAQITSRIGLYPSEAPETSVAIRVDACEVAEPRP